MQFEFQNPTRLIFGDGSPARLGEIAGAHGQKALAVTGGGGVKRRGTFERAFDSLDSLRAAGVFVAECAGVEPNPRIASVRRGAQTARQEGVDKFGEFPPSMGCPTRLSELGIGDALFGQYAKDAMLVTNDGKGRLAARPPMSEADRVEVLRSAL